MGGYEEAIQFERKVAAIYRTLGASVEHNVALAGNQIDILVSEKTQSGSTVRCAIECKAYTKPVGIQLINSLAGLAILLKNRGLIEKAVLVSKSGFTTRAREAANEHGIDLVELEDLEQMVTGHENELLKAQSEIELEDSASDKEDAKSALKKAFVVMPFTSEFDDIYVLGIREVAEQLGIVVERVDGIEHNSSIPDVIARSIANCSLVIAETSLPNPNVYYEVGMAHGLGKETILICRETKNIPFDLAAVNHIIYSSIVELREKLTKRLQIVLEPNAS